MLMSQTLTYVLLLANWANRTQSVSDLIGYEHFLFLTIKVGNYQKRACPSMDCKALATECSVPEAVCGE